MCLIMTACGTGSTGTGSATSATGGSNNPPILSAGQITKFPVAANSDLEGSITGPDGNLWFTEPGAGKIGRIVPGK